MAADRKAPIRWLSPETMSTSTYTQFTDVFAFGVLCWEVLENAATPYPGLMVQEVRNKVVLEDFRMTISDKAPPALVELMVSGDKGSEASEHRFITRIMRFSSKIVYSSSKKLQKRPKFIAEKVLDTWCCSAADNGASASDGDGNGQKSAANEDEKQCGCENGQGPDYGADFEGGWKRREDDNKSTAAAAAEEG